MRVYLRACAVVTCLLGFGFLLPAIAGQPNPIPAVVTPKPPAKPKLTVKVFKLERAEPESVIQSMSSLLDETDIELPQPPQPMQPGGVILVLPGFGGQLGVLGQPVGFGGNPLGNLGCGFGAMANPTTPTWRATGDDRTGSVVVRGSEHHLKVAADLVAILDRKANSPLPKLQVLNAFALKHAEAGAISNTIDALVFDQVRMSILGDNMLVVLAPDETTKAIADLVKELDVPARPEKKDDAPKAE